jgi:hypothetical protein
MPAQCQCSILEDYEAVDVCYDSRCHNGADGRWITVCPLKGLPLTNPCTTEYDPTEQIDLLIDSFIHSVVCLTTGKPI